MKQQLFIDNVDGRTVHGHILLSNYKPGEIEVILHTFVEVKGKVGTEKIGIVSHSLEPHTISTSSDKIPFSLIVDDHNIATYIGKYISFNHTIEAEILFDERKTKRTKEYYEVKNDYNYVVNEEKYQVVHVEDPLISFFFNLLGFFNFSVFFILLLSPILGILFPEVHFIQSFLNYKQKIFSIVINANMEVFLSCVALFAFLFTPIIKIFDIRCNEIYLNLAISKAPEGFTANLTYNREKFQVTQLWYEIIEHVIDDRGTLKSEYNHQIYSSNKVELSDYHTFSFPDIKGLRPVVTQNMAIVWRLKGIGRSKGFISMKKKFEMSLKVGIENFDKV